MLPFTFIHLAVALASVAGSSASSGVIKVPAGENLEKTLKPRNYIWGWAKDQLIRYALGKDPLERMARLDGYDEYVTTVLEEFFEDQVATEVSTILHTSKHAVAKLGTKTLLIHKPTSALSADSVSIPSLISKDTSAEVIITAVVQVTTEASVENAVKKKKLIIPVTAVPSNAVGIQTADSPSEIDVRRSQYEAIMSRIEEVERARVSAAASNPALADSPSAIRPLDAEYDAILSRIAEYEKGEVSAAVLSTPTPLSDSAPRNSDVASNSLTPVVDPPRSAAPQASNLVPLALSLPTQQAPNVGAVTVDAPSQQPQQTQRVTVTATGIATPEEPVAEAVIPAQPGAVNSPVQQAAATVGTGAVIAPAQPAQPAAEAVIPAQPATEAVNPPVQQAAATDGTGAVNAPAQPSQPAAGAVNPPVQQAGATDVTGAVNAPAQPAQQVPGAAAGTANPPAQPAQQIPGAAAGTANPSAQPAQQASGDTTGAVIPTQPVQPTVGSAGAADVPAISAGANVPLVQPAQGTAGPVTIIQSIISTETVPQSPAVPYSAPSGVTQAWDINSGGRYWESSTTQVFDGEYTEAPSLHDDLIVDDPSYFFDQYKPIYDQIMTYVTDNKVVGFRDETYVQEDALIGAEKEYLETNIGGMPNRNPHYNRFAPNGYPFIDQERMERFDYTYFVPNHFLDQFGPLGAQRNMPASNFYPNDARRLSDNGNCGSDQLKVCGHVNNGLCCRAKDMTCGQSYDHCRLDHCVPRFGLCVIPGQEDNIVQSWENSLGL